MLYMPQAEVSRAWRYLAWAKRPLESLDNPVRRYLGNRSVGPGLWKRQSPWTFWRNSVLRPAF